jgi:hypothetical protein
MWSRSSLGREVADRSRPPRGQSASLPDLRGAVREGAIPNGQRNEWRNAYAGRVPFDVDDIQPVGNVPGTTAFEYTVSRDGKEIGCARSKRVPALINSGQDPREWIARRLTDTEESEGFDRVAAALRSTLDLD